MRSIYNRRKGPWAEEGPCGVLLSLLPPSPVVSLLGHEIPPPFPGIILASHTPAAPQQPSTADLQTRRTPTASAGNRGLALPEGTLPRDTRRHGVPLACPVGDDVRTEAEEARAGYLDMILPSACQPWAGQGEDCPANVTFPLPTP